MVPSIGMSELYRLLGRLKRHAKVLSYDSEDGKIALVVGYASMRDRISTRVLLSSWVGKRTYRSVRMPQYRNVRKTGKLAA